MKSPLSLPTRTAPIGPSQGIFERVRAAEAQSVEIVSGSFLRQLKAQSPRLCTSFLIRPLKSGRIVRSTTRPVKMASSDGRPSFYESRAQSLFAGGIISFLVINHQREISTDS